MEHLFLSVVHTVELRPYVFGFLLVYMLGCSLHLGLKRALLFLITGYSIAWLSEYSSIHNGIPYGYYYYIEQTKDREIWVLGVPLIDSMSYVFLAYASYSVALLITAPVIRLKRMLYVLETREIRNSAAVRILGALLFVYLDIIIDPVALVGRRWFLGQLYGYPERGVYFGVPISNFAGWLIVGYCMIYALQKIDDYLNRSGAKDFTGYRCDWRHLIGPGLYAGVLAFNLSITFAVREYTSGWAGIFIVLLPSALVYWITKNKLASGDNTDALDAHLRDFPPASITSCRDLTTE